MERRCFYFTLLCCSILWVSCASSYKPIHPETIPFNNLSSDDNVAFSYRYDVLNETNNKKYAKKESKKGIKVVAVSVTNNAGVPVTFGTDIRLYSGNREIIPVAAQTAASELKQSTPIYLLYGLLTFMTFNQTTTTNGYTKTETTPIGVFIGPPITIGNMVVSGNANKKFKSELMTNDIWGRQIAQGETVKGLLSIAEVGYNPLTIKVVNK